MHILLLLFSGTQVYYFTCTPQHLSILDALQSYTDVIAKSSQIQIENIQVMDGGGRRFSARASGSSALVVALTVIFVLDLATDVHATKGKSCYVGQISTKADGTASTHNSLAMKACGNDQSLCSQCCSYSYNATDFQSGEQVSRCISWISTDKESCALETPSSLDGRHRLWTCDSTENCLACGEFVPPSVSSGGRIILPFAVVQLLVLALSLP